MTRLVTLLSLTTALALPVTAKASEKATADLQRAHAPAKTQWSISGAYLLHNSRNSGGIVSVDLDLGKRKRHRFVVGLAAGAIHHRNYQTAVLAYVRSGYRFTSRRGFRLGVYGGVGYAHSFLTAKSYEVVNGKLKERSNTGRPLLAISSETEIGWDFGQLTKVPLTVFLRPQMIGFLPVNRHFAPNLGGQIGVSYAF